MSVTIFVVGSFVAASCALVGSFLVLRRLALLGDAISHAVLPGIVIAFFLSGSRSPLPMILGAGALGVLTVFLVELLNRTRRLHEDASIGVVFPALFALGVILVSAGARNVDLDVDCVLYGEIEFAALDTFSVGGVSLGPRSLWVTGTILALDALLVLIFFKELKVTTFDPDLADSLGISSVAMHYVLMTAVSVTVVGAFESVGAILVVAMLIVPPATAYLLTRRLAVMLVLAVGLGVASACGGYLLARQLDCSIAGAMASVSGVLFVLTMLFAPEAGLVARAWRRRTLRRRLCGRLLLLHVQEGGAGTTREALARRFGWSVAFLESILRPLLDDGLLEYHGGRMHLTADGKATLEEAGALPLVHHDSEAEPPRPRS